MYDEVNNNEWARTEIWNGMEWIGIGIEVKLKLLFDSMSFINFPNFLNNLYQ